MYQPKPRWMSSAKALVLALCTIVATYAGPFSDLVFAQQSAGEAKPMAIVMLTGYDGLMEDIDFVGSLAGQQALGQNLEQMIMLFTQNKGLAGLDKTKPLGLIVQTQGANPSGAICIPVSSLKELTDTLAPFDVKSEEQGNGIYQISAGGQTLFAREGKGWAFLSMMPQMLEGLPDNPGELLNSLAKDYDLAVQVNVQNIPEHFRQMAIGQLQAGMESGMQQLDDESDEQFQARKEMTTLQIEQLQRAINEIDELTVGLSIDNKQQRAYFDFVYTAVPGTQLAEQVTQNSDPKTDFAGFFQPDAAMMLSFASKVSESDIAQMNQMFDAMRKQIQTAIDDEADLPSDKARETVKSAADDFMDAFRATVQAGIMDGGAVLNMAPDSFTLVAGGFVGDPGKVESGLKKLAELAKEEPDFPGIQWNAASHGDVNFHTLNVPIPEDKNEPRQLFGETLDVAIGIGQKSVFFALGRDCVEALKGVIDASAAEPQKSVPPMEMTIAIGQIMEVVATFADEEDKTNIAMIASMLETETNGRDHVKIVVQPIPNGARTRIEVEEGVLRAIGMAVMQAQMQGAGAGL